MSLCDVPHGQEPVYIEALVSKEPLKDSMNGLSVGLPERE
jgi:hypothetical protein